MKSVKKCERLDESTANMDLRGLFRICPLCFFMDSNQIWHSGKQLREYCGWQ